MTVSELTSLLWYSQEIRIVSETYAGDREIRILWQGQNYQLRSITAKEFVARQVVSFGIVDNVLVIVTK